MIHEIREFDPELADALASPGDATSSIDIHDRIVRWYFTRSEYFDCLSRTARFAYLALNDSAAIKREIPWITAHVGWGADTVDLALLLADCRRGDRITTRIARQLLGEPRKPGSQSTAKRRLAVLVKLGALARAGTGKTAHFVLTAAMRDGPVHGERRTGPS